MPRVGKSMQHDHGQRGWIALFDERQRHAGGKRHGLERRYRACRACARGDIEPRDRFVDQYVHWKVLLSGGVTRWIDSGVVPDAHAAGGASARQIAAM